MEKQEKESGPTTKWESVGIAGQENPGSKRGQIERVSAEVNDAQGQAQLAQGKQRGDQDRCFSVRLPGILLTSLSCSS